MKPLLNLAILSSSRGSVLDTLVQAMEDKKLHATIKVVISNKSDALILEKAAAFGLNTIHVSSKDLSRPEYDTKISDLLRSYHIDLVVLLGYMRILSPVFIEAWRNTIINVHPSLLPDFAGLMDLEVHEAVLKAKRSLTGCTVHSVTEEVDAGPILLQKTCPVYENDTPLLLKARVQALEGHALIETIQSFETVGQTHESRSHHH